MVRVVVGDEQIKEKMAEASKDMKHLLLDEQKYTHPVPLSITTGGFPAIYTTMIDEKYTK